MVTVKVHGDKKHNHVFVSGHYKVWQKGKTSPRKLNIKEIHCACGCGQKIKVRVGSKTDSRRKFVHGHNMVLTGDYAAWNKRKHPYPVVWNAKLKRSIRKRDKFTCQECGYTEEQLGYPLSVHHIDYVKVNCEPENLISLCKSCHTKTNHKRQDWIDYYQRKRADAGSIQ